ncbi:threonine synthase [Thecamonas trahens ATCC 50062]|uniref:Threonine synthase n=1 Tax=Thecamonas trahens ATCC 50062 TaxID=461836 RepID=A0A0L0DAP8_THETB|nr:threonine synthase [Thecamonas trahens ATCC 50062]KNC48373.1 threonine synthase [Thecamonas trahens ATCC 50062]|eukprot:XP_013758493.1 threonine synthase [Thecamonas trahens ATCC 50062]
MVTYVSTRGQAPAVDFATAVLAGQAPDGGLYVPSSLPHLSLPRLASLIDADYAALAAAVMAPFVGDSLTTEELDAVLRSAFAAPDRFDTSDVAPLASLASHPDTSILELWHGPSLAFKDMAIGVLARLLAIFAARAPGPKPTNIVVATSGDTGPAAVAAAAGIDPALLHLWVLFPHNRVSREQAAQMQCELPPNVTVLEVANSDSDSLDTILDDVFNDKALAKDVSLGSLNSINVARVLLQSVHYIYAFLAHIRARAGPGPHSSSALCSLMLAHPIRFAVPTGACGDMVGGLYAAAMGLPVSEFVIATNANAIVADTLTHARLVPPPPVVPTLSNAIDILVPYNLWRFLYHTAAAECPTTLSAWIDAFRSGATVTLPPLAAWGTPAPFRATSISDATTLATIAATYAADSYLLDPHSAVALAGSVAIPPPSAGQLHTICLATAHPAKFVDVVHAALPLVDAPAGIAHPSMDAALAATANHAVQLPSVAAANAYLRRAMLELTSSHAPPARDVHIASPDDIAAAVSWADALAAARLAFSASPDDIVGPMPMAFDFADACGESHVKGAHIGGSSIFALKVASSFYKASPSGSGLVLVFSATNGAPLAVLLDNARLTDMRTAAAGTLAITTLRPGPITKLAILGAGIQASKQLASLAAAVEIRSDALAAADVVITATPASNPLIASPDWLAPSALVVAVGSDSPHKQELDASVLHAALSAGGAVIVDSIEQTAAFGELRSIAHVLPHPGVFTLGDIVRGTALPPPASALTIVDLTGMGVQDAALAEIVYNRLASPSRL